MGIDYLLSDLYITHFHLVVEPVCTQNVAKLAAGCPILNLITFGNQVYYLIGELFTSAINRVPFIYL